MEHKLGKRLICSLMALIMALGCVPVPAAAQGDGAENASHYGGDILEETEKKEYFTVVPSEDFPDNEELFAYYADSALYGYDIRSYGVLNRNKLNHVEQGIYDVLKNGIETIAMNGGSTEFCIESVDGMKTTWTNEELGVTSLVEDDVVSLFFQQFDLEKLMDALLGDCPFDLYWFDKTVGMGGGCGMSVKTMTSGSQTFNVEATVTLYINFAVAEEFAEANYKVTSDVSKVQTAKDNAAAVVASNQGKTPYQKVTAYKEYICSAVNYNDDALKPGTPYGNPWQLIYVFDGDSSTKVVCEGYSKAFQYLCDLSGVDCLSVVGTMNGGDHMWNVVTLEGKNYLADVTNSDTGKVGQNGELFLVGGSYQNGGYTFRINGWSWFYACEDCDLATSKYTPGHVCTSATKIARVEPTCVNEGCEEYWQCTSCGKRYADSACSNEVQASELVIPATGHAMRGVPAEAATCTKSGNNAYFVCENCKGVFADEEGTVSTTVKQQTIPASGHTEETIDGYAATCTKDGLTDGKRCSVCGEIITAQQIITAPGHKEEDVFGYAATCTKNGLTDGKKCSVCGTVTVEQKDITAPGHTEVTDEAVAATCSKTGLTEGKHCSVCDEVIVAQKEIPALGHQEVVDDAVKPTCTESGKTEGKHCSVCGEVLVAQKVIPAGHTEVIDKAVDPSCTESGKTEGKHCSVCGEVLVAQKVIPAGHTEVIDKAVDPTCTESGKTEGKHCSVCGEVLIAQKVIPAGHTEVIDKAVDPTCTESGKTEGKHCSVCDEVIVAQKEIPALGHQEVVDDAVKPTCTESGLTEGKHCSACDKVFVAQEEIPALGHEEVIDDAVPATCTETGLTEGKHCDVCGKVITAQQVVPAGHQVVTISGEDATCTKAGLTEGKECSACGKILKAQETIPALEHKASYTSLQEATLTEPGLKGHYQCMNCKKYFRDASCTIEAEEESFIIPAVKTVQLSSTRYSYDGKTKTPKVGVKDSEGNKLVKDKDYTVTYDKGRKKVGQYNVTMKGIGNYSFRITLTFQIVPPKSSIKSLTGKAKSFIASWSKKTSQVTGYQLQYSLDKNFETGVKTVTIKDNDVTSKTIKSLKSKKYYYVRIRTYKTVSGKNFYSGWSDALRVKTK